MGTVTPAVIGGEGYVRVEVTWQDVPSTRRALVYRQVAGLRTLLRDGAPSLLSNGIGVCYDHEAPLDVPLTYVSTVSLNANGSFEAGVSEWLTAANNGTVGTVERSFDYYAPDVSSAASLKLTPAAGATSKAVSELIPVTPSASNANPLFNSGIASWTGANGAVLSADATFTHEGAGSLLITPNGVSAVPQAQSEEIAVVAGRSYTYSGWVRVSTGGSGNRDVGIVWFDASHSFISGSTTTLTPAPTVWTQYGPTVAVAPVGAAYARLVTNGPGVLTAANTWRLDEAILWDATTATSYTLTGRLMVPTYWAGGIGVQLQWYYGTTLLGTSGTLADVTPFPGAWGSYSLTTTDMATANGVRLVAGITGSPPTTQILYADELYLTTPASTAIAADVVLPSSGGGWWTDPLHPATKARLSVDLRSSDCLTQSSIVYLGSSERVRAADAQMTEVNDSPYPVATWARRKSGGRSLGVGTMTEADRDQLDALHDSGAPLFLQLPLVYREADRYTLCGDLTVASMPGDQRKPWRVCSTQYREVEAPVGPANGTWNTRYADLDRYATFGAATAAGATWLDGLRGVLAV